MRKPNDYAVGALAFVALVLALAIAASFDVRGEAAPPSDPPYEFDVDDVDANLLHVYPHRRPVLIQTDRSFSDGFESE